MYERPGPVTKDLIREKATALFHQKGYHATTMREIAEAVGIVKGGLYYHYPSKQSILEEITSEIENLITLELGKIASSAMPVEERLREVARRLVYSVITNQDVAWVVFFEQHSLPLESGAKNAQNNKRFRRLIRQLIEEGMTEGIFESENPALSTLAVLGACNWTTLWYSSNGTQSPEQIADYISDFVLNGLLAREKSDNRPRVQASVHKLSAPSF